MPNYSPTSRGGPASDERYAEATIGFEGTSGRKEYPQTNRADDFEQAGLLYRILSAEEQTRLVNNIAGHMQSVSPEIQRRQIGHFLKADLDYGSRIAQQLNQKADEAAASAGV